MSLINLIIFFLNVFSFIKKKNVIYLFVKYRLKLISVKIIIDSCFFIIKKNLDNFKNNLLSMLIKHFVFK